jgi:hypothetical protein
MSANTQNFTLPCLPDVAAAESFDANPAAASAAPPKKDLLEMLMSAPLLCYLFSGNPPSSQMP